MTLTLRSILTSLALFLALPACASTANQGPARNSDVITAEEFRGRSHTTAYEVVRSLRPQWLRVRLPISLTVTQEDLEEGEIVIYLDNIRYGRVSTLESVRAQTIEKLERIDGLTATQRWGTGHGSGVISVTTRVE